MSVVNCSFDHPMKLEENAAGPLAGGIANHGYQCGMLWGATLAAGAQAYRLLGSGPEAEIEAIGAAQRITESFRARTHDQINCLEITEMNFQGKHQALPILKFLMKGGPIGCFRMAAGYAPEACGAITAALSERRGEAPPSPISCSAMLARKMGQSEMHAIMAAGFAGGIGLSGGACGALGTAIWIIGMNSRKEGATKKIINSRITDTIDRFLKSTADFRFECSEIVGRKFENVNDHARYLHEGGCTEIIEVLAAR